MHIIINGEQREFKSQMNITALLKELGLEKKPVVVELNKEIITKENYGRELSSNDSLEVVTFVGGG